jgi:hypothetical protein
LFPDATADVYAIEEGDPQGVWQVQNVLEPIFSDDLGQYEVHTLSIEVDNTPGVLNQVTSGVGTDWGRDGVLGPIGADS